MERVISFWTDPDDPKQPSLADLAKHQKSNDGPLELYKIPIRNEYWSRWKEWCKKTGVFSLNRLQIEVENFIRDTVPPVAKEALKVQDVAEEVKKFRLENSFAKN